MSLVSRNPATGEVFGSIAAFTSRDVEAAIERAVSAFASWRRQPIEARTRVLSRVADLLEAEAPRLGRLMTLEMGKPIGPADDEARKSRAAAATTRSTRRRSWPTSR